jgi:putative intracellular protease/amidase
MMAAMLLACAAAPLAWAGGGSAAAEAPRTRNVAILVYPGVEILDFAGPSEVLQAAGSFADHSGTPAFRLYTVGRGTAPVVSQRFIRITPDQTIADAPRPDILVIPGGASDALSQDPEMMAWIKKSATEAEVTLTVCTGVFPLAKAGLLDGLDITTFYNAVSHLRTEAPRATVHAGRRFIDNGRFITTAGVSAGIDGSLHLVARLLGRQVAERTAQYMEYRWAPEAYLASTYPYLNPSTDDDGRALQQAGVAEEQGDTAAAAREYRRLLERRPDNAAASYQLGRLLVGSRDYEGAYAAFAQAAASPGLAASASYNAACALALQKRKTEAVQWLEKAIAAGFSDPKAILSDPDLASLRDEPRVLALIVGAGSSPAPGQ